MRSSILLLLFLVAFISSAEACMKGGIAPRASAALIGLCVIFSPVIIVGALGYGAVSVASEATKKVKATSRSIEDRRRTSNVIRQQRNRMVKKVGAKNFENYLQQLVDKCKIEPTPDNFLETGTALFLNNDLLAALDYISKVIQSPQVGWNKIGAAYFVRGMINQYLFDFTHAIEDFETAQKSLPKERIADTSNENSAGQLTLADALNAAGFARMQKTLYGANTIQPDEAPLELLTQALTEITKAIECSPEKQGMYYHNRGFTRYHRSYLIEDPAEQKKELKLSLDDFDEAIGSGNFGTTAEGHSMKAQTLARLGEMDLAKNELNLAVTLDPKVFRVLLESEGELRTPWPLPRDKYRNQDNAHSFYEKQFHTFHFCDYCSELIKAEAGYRCFVCDYKAHKQCYKRVATKDCWVAMRSKAIKSDGTQTTVLVLDEPDGAEKPEEVIQKHIHHLKAVHFHKPTWCDLCSKIVASPFGKQGFQCTDCRAKLHKDCLELAGTFIIE